MEHNAAFDTIAAGYDEVFSESLIGREQRRQSREHLKAFLINKTNLQILEINCGTGDDAIWLSSLGHHVTATDQSPEMIRTAQKKAGAGIGSLRFLTCSFEELNNTFNGKKFDLIFSNFAGLNCCSTEQLKELSKHLYHLLNDNGHLAVVIFGKYTWWETFYYLWKRDRLHAFRRWGQNEVMAQLAEGVYQSVYYYSSGSFAKLMSPLRVIKKRPVGLFIPPSYMENAMQKHPRFFQSMVRMEKMAKGLGGSTWSDHTYILFKKEAT